MPNHHRALPAVLAVVLAGCTLRMAGAPPAADAPTADAAAAWRRPPLALVPNAGQWPGQIRFAAQAGPRRLWLERDALVVEARAGDGGRQVFALQIEGADPDCTPVAAAPQPARYSYFLGNDPAQWRSGLPGYASVRWPAIRPGVDLLLTTAGAEPEYTLEVASRAALAELRFRCRGQTALTVDDGGALHLVGARGEVVQSPPKAWQTAADGSRRPLAIRCVVDGPDAFRFAAADADDGAALCVDPMLSWATYVGGSAFEWGYAISRLADGTVLVAGETTSSDFPTTAGAFDPSYNGVGPPSSDAYVARITADGTGVVYATYLGGSGGDKAYGIVGNGAGEATVVGAAGSANFPTTPGAYDTTLGGSSDAFVARLSADGSTLLFSTLLGGSDADDAEDVALDASGGTWIVGVTSSPTFPTTAGALQSARSGTSDAFVAHLSANGSTLLASTLLGGSDGDVGKGIAVHADGSVTVGGVTSSIDFPTTAGAFQTALLGSSDAFVARLEAGCQSLRMSTLCGGGSGDVGEGVAVTRSGLSLLTGVTSSTDFPTSPGAYDRTPAGASDAFVAAFDAQGHRRFATLIGGSGGDVGKALYATPAGTIVVGGQTSSSDFPTTPGAVLGSGSGSADAFVAHLAADGSGLLCATLFGGSGSDGGEDVDGTDDAAAALTGVSNSRNLPVGANAWSTSQLGTNDGFAAVLDLRPAGVARYGSSTPACSGAIAAAVTRWPAAGAADFAFTCVQAPAGSLGFLVLGFAPAPGLPILGITAWLDPQQPLLTAATFADDLGTARVPLSLAGIGAGTHFYVQFVWFDPPGCGPATGLSASDALGVTVQ